MPAMTHPEPVARRLFDLFEPVHLVTYFTEEPDEELGALGMRNYWDGYFASRAAAVGEHCPPEVVHAVFYNFAPGEVARHIPYVWSLTTPAEAFAARQRGAARAIRRILGEAAAGPDVARAGELMVRAATAAPTEGRALFAGLLAMPVPDDPVARLYHAATLLREHRGDGHIAALVAHGIGGLESHVLAALDMGMPAQRYGRIHHLPAAQIGAVVDGLRARGLVDDTGAFTEQGRATKDRIEAMTDALAEPPWQALIPAEADEVADLLAPVAGRLSASFEL